MEDLQDLSIEINLKSVDYLVNAHIVDSTTFLLEIQSIQSAEIWKGCFEAKYIEDLTRKTGNFKSFPIFINMLYAALKQDSTTVALDILTYNDLEMLRGRKDTSSNSISSRSTTTNNKRYLILTYNVEFDRITYPLHLNYEGVPDPIELIKTVRRLKERVKAYETKSGDDGRNKVIAILEKEKEDLIREKETMALEVLKIKCDNQRKLKETTKEPSTTQQEIKVLKQMMKSIEESSVKEKNYFQRQIVKRDEELSAMRYEIGQLRANEKSLSSQIRFSEDRVRSRSRNVSANESVKQRMVVPKRPVSRQRSESPFYNHDYISARKNGQRKPVGGGQVQSRYRSSSLDREARTGTNRGSSRGTSPAGSIGGGSSCGSSVGGGGSKKRFNPTDFIRVKKEKGREIEARRKNEIRYRISGDRSGGQCNLRTRSRSANSNYSYDGGDGYNSSSIIGSHQRNNKDASYASNYDASYSVEASAKPRSGGGGRVKGNESSNVSLFNRDQEMKDIDEKLKSLQMLIKNTI